MPGELGCSIGWTLLFYWDNSIVSLGQLNCFIGSTQLFHCKYGAFLPDLLNLLFNSCVRLEMSIDKRRYQIKKTNILVLLLKERGGVLTQKCTKMFYGAKTKNNQDTLKHKLNKYFVGSTGIWNQIRTPAFILSSCCYCCSSAFLTYTCARNSKLDTHLGGSIQTYKKNGSTWTCTCS